MGNNKLFIFYDNEIEGHFPPHFRDVYMTLLSRDHDLDVGMCAMTDGTSTDQSFEALWLKRSPHTFIGRFIYAFYQFFRVIKLCLLNKTLKEADTILLHNDPIAGFVLCFYSRLTGKRFIYRITHLKYEEILANSARILSLMAKFGIFIRNMLVKKSDHVVVMSDSMAIYIATCCQRSIGDITVVPSVVNPVISCRCDNHSRVMAIKEELNSRKCDFWLIYVGTLAESRDVSFLIDVLDNLHDCGVNAGLLILGVGSDAQRKFIIETASDFSLLDYLLVVPAVSECEMQELIEYCDIGLSPYPIESNSAFLHNSPVKLFNYIQAKIPVVGSRVPDQDLVVRQCQNGFCVDNDPKLFARAVKELLSIDRKLIHGRLLAAQEWLVRERSVKVAARLIASCV